MGLNIDKIEKLENGNVVLYKSGKVKKLFLPTTGVRLYNNETVRLLDLNGTDHYDFKWESVKEILVNGSAITYSVNNIGDFIKEVLYTHLFHEILDPSTSTKQDDIITELKSIRECIELLPIVENSYTLRYIGNVSNNLAQIFSTNGFTPDPSAGRRGAIKNIWDSGNGFAYININGGAATNIDARVSGVAQNLNPIVMNNLSDFNIRGTATNSLIFIIVEIYK